MMVIDPELSDMFSEEDAFSDVMVMQGMIYRAKEGRRTIKFDYNGKEYFAKIHHGIGWGEIIKNLTSFRLPIVDASNEWRAVNLLEDIGVRTVRIAGKGVRGVNPAKRESFVIMDALDERVELEDFLKDMGGLEGRRRLELKRVIIRKVAKAAKRMHRAGMNHRDFYLCHFHIVERDWSDWKVSEAFELPLLDLHRAQIRKRVPLRWLAKDLGALLFSAIDCQITSTDVVAWLRVYLGDDWKKDLSSDAELWSKVVQRACSFYRKHRGEEPVLPRVIDLLMA